MSLAIENTTPGVTALVNQSEVARPMLRQPSSTAFLVGYSAWGPVGVPTIVTSWADFVRKFGGHNANSYLADAVYVFFQFYGGRQAYISRVVGATPVLATKDLNDGAGTPLATLQVDAKYPSSDVDVKVTVAAGTTANTRKLTFRSVALNVTEVFDNVTLEADSLANINERSKLVNVTDLESATAAPNNLPAVAAEASLVGGDDDFANAGATQFVAGLAPFADTNLGGGQVAIPGRTDATVYAALKTHAETYQRLAIVDPALGNDVSEMLAVDTSAYRSSHVALYYPWVKMLRLDGVNNTKFFPPSIFAIGACAMVDRTKGTHKAPAGIDSPAFGAIDVERNTDGSPMFTDAARGSLNAKQINVIAPIAGQGILIYGSRLLHAAGETRVQMVHERRVLNLIYYTAKIGYAWAVFQTVGPKLFRDLKTTGQNFLRALWKGGALYGRTEAEAFVVTADETNNPPEELDQHRVHVQMGVKLSPTAEQVIVNIDNVPISQDLGILNGGEN